jgi:hypothetical protein
MKKDYSKEWLRLQRDYPAIEPREQEPEGPTYYDSPFQATFDKEAAGERSLEVERLYTAYLKRKAQAEAARYLAQKEYTKSKPTQINWLVIAVVYWICSTVHYMATHNLT